MKALVTGGTSGIGYGVACHLIKKGWTVQIVGRDAQRGEQVAAAIGADFIQADLSLMADAARVADQINGSIDALVMCAGGVSLDAMPQRTAEGHEVTFATNYLSRFVLSQSLLPRMTHNGSIVMVSGDGRHKGVSTEWAMMQSGMTAARMAALAVDLYAAHLAQQARSIRVHTCYPGVVRTDMLRGAPWLIRLYVRLLGTSIEQGSAHLANLVMQPHNGVHWDRNAPMYFASPLPPDRSSLIDYSQSVLNKDIPVLHKELQHAI